eukprot:2692131-Amphidinium_carterae.1
MEPVKDHNSKSTSAKPLGKGWASWQQSWNGEAIGKCSMRWWGCQPGTPRWACAGGVAADLSRSLW